MTDRKINPDPLFAGPAGGTATRLCKRPELARERLALHLELVIEAPSGNIVMVATASGSEIQPDIGTAEAWIKARLAAQEAP